MSFLSVFTLLSFGNVPINLHLRRRTHFEKCAGQLELEVAARKWGNSKPGSVQRQLNLPTSQPGSVFTVNTGSHLFYTQKNTFYILG
ncbi:hypothetical protein EXN66_Car009805 [Channa argus]|uniref:Uncharacterized protein n=1 Tax=Channa argus TaxID=215402 RepID=A0A6G1PV70_CHAAH|nr:hypothetical protein EXN66_Car009805 [Channa argus]